jgi:hypothetical protein
MSKPATYDIRFSIKRGTSHARPGTFAAGWNDAIMHLPVHLRNGVSAGEYAQGFRAALDARAGPEYAFNQTTVRQ